MNFDREKMTHAWAILTDLSKEDRWEPDRYNAAAFVKLLLETYEKLMHEFPNILEQTTWPGFERHQHADGSWCQRKITDA